MSTGRSIMGGADIFLLYLEAIARPDRFRAVADKAAAAGKPLIVAKVGRSDCRAPRRGLAYRLAGACRQRSTTRSSAITGSSAARTSTTCSTSPPPLRFARCRAATGSRSSPARAAVRCGWPTSCRRTGSKLPVLEDEIQRRILALLPSYASAQNPVDATAQAIHEVGYAPTRRDGARVAADRHDPADRLARQRSHRGRSAPRNLRRWPAPRDKPILLSTYTSASPGAMAAFAEAGIPCYTSMPSCARAIQALVDYARFQARLHRPPPPATTPSVHAEAARALAAAGTVLTENEAKALLAGYGIPRPPEELATSANDAVAAAARIGGAVALKVQSPDITHKTEAGGVALGIDGETAVRSLISPLYFQQRRIIIRYRTIVRPEC